MYLQVVGRGIDGDHIGKLGTGLGRIPVKFRDAVFEGFPDNIPFSPDEVI